MGLSGKLRAVDPLSPFTAPVPDKIRARLIALQADRLRAALPLLCLLTIANTIAMSVAVMGDQPWWQQALPPLTVGGACAILLLRRRIQRRLDPETILRRAPVVAFPLGLVAGFWGVSAFSETEQYYCMVAPTFIALAAVIASSGLSAVPRAAIAAMIGAVTPLAVKLASYEFLSLRALATMLVIVAVMQAMVLLSKFRETVAMLVAEHELDRLAREDALTGLASRRALMEALDARRIEGGPATLVLADVDGLKPVNDAHGHAAGDALLRTIAAVLVGAGTRARIVARLGGDEFALLFDDARDAEAAIARARIALAVPALIAGRMLAPAASFGLASAAQADAHDLLQRADLAMYRDKATRRALAA